MQHLVGPKLKVTVTLHSFIQSESWSFASNQKGLMFSLRWLTLSLLDTTIRLL